MSNRGATLMNKANCDWLLLLGRVLLGAIFVVAGFSKLMTFNASMAMMASQGIPMAGIALALAIVFELGGGLMVVLGYKARLGALMLFVFIIPVTFVFHSFWGMEGAEMANQSHHFLKNLSMMGGCLYVMACGAGAYSIDKS